MSVEKSTLTATTDHFLTKVTRFKIKEAKPTTALQEPPSARCMWHGISTTTSIVQPTI